MSRYRLRIRPEAQNELLGAVRWYEERASGLGRDFLRAFRQGTNPLRQNPFHNPVVTGDARRLLLRRFPYSVFYEVHDFDVVILACFHEARDPAEWMRRTSGD